MCAMYPNTDRRADLQPLYDQAALDAALNLWPRDCRLCANFTTKTGGCVSVVQCVDSMQFKATPPRQYWVSAPNTSLKGDVLGANVPKRANVGMLQKKGLRSLVVVLQ